MNFTGFNIYGDPSVGLFTTGEDIEVAVDIKPGSFPNSINPRSKGVIPVAILTTDTFDATTVDPLSVKFGPDGATEAHGRGHRADVNRDGKKDLVLHFRTTKGVVQAVDGVSFELGYKDAVVVIGESGCGKTSLAKAILRLLSRNVAKYSGKTYLSGNELMGLNEEEFRENVSRTRSGRFHRSFRWRTCVNRR